MTLSTAKTRHLQLPFQFDSQRLQNDLSNVLQREWISHFNKGGYEGNWTAIPLYSYGGRVDNILALSTEGEEILPTEILNDCTYIKEVLENFEAPILSARLLKLEVGAKISPHRDYKLGYEDNVFRIHIPIATNDDVQFILDGERVKMEVGECWYTNVNYIHSVENNGTEDRIHIVIDLERNAWSDKLFFSLAPKESFLPEEQEESPIVLKQIIEQLKLTQPQATELIEGLEKKLESLEND